MEKDKGEIMDRILENIISAIIVGALLICAGFAIDTISLVGTNLIGVAIRAVYLAIGSYALIWAAVVGNRYFRGVSGCWG